MAASRSTHRQEYLVRRAVNVRAPVWPKSPAAEAFLPLVLLIAALAPGLTAWMYGTLTAESAAWGLCGLDVLDGDWRVPGPEGQAASPVFAWTTALALKIPLVDQLLALNLPAYLFGVASLATIYGLGRVWFTAGAGLLTCFLVSMNRVFLHQVQHGEPGVAVLFWTVLGLLAYARHLRNEEETFSIWTLVGAVAFAGLLLTEGFNAFWMPVVGVLHVVSRELRRKESWGPALRSAFASATLRAGFIVVGGGVLIASHWLITSGMNSGPLAPWSSPVGAEPRYSLRNLVGAMPATVVLAAFGLWKSFWITRKGTEESDRTSLPLLWSLVALLALETTRPTSTGLLLAVAPLTMMAVRTLQSILRREVRDGQVFYLMLVSLAVLTASQLRSIRELPLWKGISLVSPSSVIASFEAMGPQDKFQLHLGLDVVLLVSTLVVWLYMAARSQDRYRRWLFGGFFLATLFAASLVSVLREDDVLRRDDPWVKLYDQLQQQRPVDRVIFVGLKPPGPELTFIVRSLFPDLPRSESPRREHLEASLKSESDRPLVLVTDVGQRLPPTYPVSIGSGTLTLSQVIDSPLVAGYRPIQTPTKR